MKHDPNLHIRTNTPMSVFRVDSWGWRLVCPEQPARDYRQLLRHRLASLTDKRAITVMVHGAGFSPFSRRADAQGTLYARQMIPVRWQSRAWPTRFSNAYMQSSEYLAIGFGWNAMDNAVLSKPNNQNLFDAAQTEAPNLATFINELSAMSEGRDINIVCHGLGARVVIQSFEHMKPNALSRVVILGGHEFSTNTLTALGEPAAKGVSFYNIRSDRLFASDQRANAEMPKSGPKDQVLALGFLFQRHNWVDIDTSHNAQRLQLLPGANLPVLRRPNCKWSFGPDIATDDLIARICHCAINTSVQSMKDRIFANQEQPDNGEFGFLKRHSAILSPLRRRRAW
jgi:hypothetical protein